MISFSIITVARNHISGLQKTAASLRGEDPALFEWIVVDGASNDGSVDFLQTTNAYPLAAHWTSEADDGIYDAMNKGLSRARGEYVLFLNAGDVLALARTLECLSALLKARPIKPALIYGDAFEDGPAGRVVKTARPHGLLRQGLFTHHQSIFYSRAVIGDLRYDTRYDIAADYKFTAAFLSRCPENEIFYWPPICLFEAGGVSQRQAFRGRMQQALIRRELRMTLPIEELMIIARQTFAYGLRRWLPRLYWRLRTSE